MKESGSIEHKDDTSFWSPSGAATKAANAPACDGWLVCVTFGLVALLKELRNELIKTAEQLRGGSAWRC